MKSISEMDQAELAAYIQSHLRNNYSKLCVFLKGSQFQFYFLKIHN